MNELNQIKSLSEHYLEYLFSFTPVVEEFLDETTGENVSVTRYIRIPATPSEVQRLDISLAQSSLPSLLIDLSEEELADLSRDVAFLEVFGKEQLKNEFINRRMEVPESLFEVELEYEEQEINDVLYKVHGSREAKEDIIRTLDDIARKVGLIGNPSGLFIPYSCILPVLGKPSGSDGNIMSYSVSDSALEIHCECESPFVLRDALLDCYGDIGIEMQIL